ncbi:MAG: MATE family efflux transporter, partial [Clostridiales Family XIII bacterium]|nr:MATE family efflux transporter [Clostridiales Family XIII bacterium]
LIILLASKGIVMLFQFSAHTSHMTVLILVVYAFMLWLKSYNSCIITGVLRSGGDTKYAMTIEICCVWLLGVPVAFAVALLTNFPVYLVVLCVQIEEIVKGLILRRRYHSMKWAKDLIEDLE